MVVTLNFKIISGKIARIEMNLCRNPIDKIQSFAS